MTVLSLPSRGRWVWDARDRTRAVRVSAHADVGLVNLSVWRDETCVGTVKLRPHEVTGLVAALTDGLAQLAVPPPAVQAPRLAAVEDRVTELEARLAPAARRPVVAALRERVRRLLG
jgi:hypothetical protein